MERIEVESLEEALKVLDALREEAAEGRIKKIGIPREVHLADLARDGLLEGVTF